MKDWIKSLPPGLKVQEVVDQLILKTLDDCKGIKLHAAETLGMSIRGFRERLRAMEARGVELPDASSYLHPLSIVRPPWLGKKKSPPEYEF